MRRSRKSPDLLLRQGEVLIGGALLYLLLVAGFIGFRWTPLVLAGVFLLAGAAGGERGDPVWPVAAAFAVWGVLAAAEVVGVVGEPGFWTIGLGLVGAFHLLFALNPGGRGGI